MVFRAHTTSNWGKKAGNTRLNKRWNCRRIYEFGLERLLGWHGNLETLGDDSFLGKVSLCNI